MLDKTNKSYGKNDYGNHVETTDDIRTVSAFISRAAFDSNNNYLLYLRNLFSKADKLEDQTLILKYFAYVSFESVKYHDKPNGVQIGTPFDVWPDLNYVIPMDVMKRFLNLVFTYRTWTMKRLVHKIQSIDDRELRNFVIEFYPVIEFVLVNSENAINKLEANNHLPKEYLNRTDFGTDPYDIWVFINKPNTFFWEF